MRILVVSLLRVGDVLMIAPVLAGLRRKYPQAEVHLLVNESSRQGAELVEGIKKVWLFPRNRLQAWLADSRSPIFLAPWEVLVLMEALIHQDFDLVLNFTHNRLSGWLCGVFPKEKVIGLRLNENGAPNFGSPWFQQLNDRADRPGREGDHFVDVFSRALDVEPEVNGALKTVQPQRRHPRIPEVVLQLLTSDDKKNWSIDQWFQCLRLFSGRHRHWRLVALAAPGEQERLLGLQERLAAVGVPFQIEVCSLVEARQRLLAAGLIVSLDTSVKHLGVDAQAPLIEVALGSSDPMRTGAYRSNTVVLRARVACAPCRHSSTCSMSEHLCGHGISATALGQLMSDLADGLSMRELASVRFSPAFTPTMEMLCIEVSASEGYRMRPVRAEALVQNDWSGRV